jgi:hypothetical protein
MRPRNEQRHKTRDNERYEVISVGAELRDNGRDFVSNVPPSQLVLFNQAFSHRLGIAETAGS